MKKWMIGLLLVMIVFFAAVYIFVGNNNKVVVIAHVKCPEAAVVRVLNDTAKWRKWWPKKTNTGDFTYNSYAYRLSKVMYNAYDIVQANNHDTLSSQMLLLRFSADSLVLKWECSVNSSTNPFKRLIQYKEAKTIRHNMQSIIDSLNNYLNKSQNIYGFPITITTLKDTTLISKKITGNEYPSTDAIYKLVTELRSYIRSTGTKETNYPMLNVRHTDSGYLTMVAIPVDREMKGNDIYFPKRMPIIKDNTLLIEVHGGVLTVQKAFAELANYMQDHHYGAPAIPFESLVTDRSKEADTTKWVTRIFAPIM